MLPEMRIAYRFAPLSIPGSGSRRPQRAHARGITMLYSVIGEYFPIPKGFSLLFLSSVFYLYLYQI
jgi:hypothetical protein